MIEYIPKHSLGKANYGWLKTHYHFSFANYFNPQRMGHGSLRVINDDVIAPNSGFEMHPHRDMEIISFVVQGAITHQDSKGNIGKTKAGEVQVITAGTGIYHSEHNYENEATHMFQIWIKPNQKGLTPSWAQATYESCNDSPLRLLVSGYEEAPLHIHQDANIYSGKLFSSQRLDVSIQPLAYLVLLRGELTIGNARLRQGDGLRVENKKHLQVVANTESEFLLISMRS